MTVAIAMCRTTDRSIPEWLAPTELHVRMADGLYKLVPPMEADQNVLSMPAGCVGD
jgi:hypothetical protein